MSSKSNVLDHIRERRHGMRSKTLSVIFGILFVASVVFDCDVCARVRGGGGSKPSGSYGNSAVKSSPGGGYGNTASKSSGTSAKPPDNSSSRGYGNSAVPGSGSGSSDSSARKKTPLQERMDRSFSKQESAKAYADYKAQQGKFRAGPANYDPAGKERTTVDSIRTRVTYTSSSDYYTRRTVFYDTYHWSPPGYVYSSYGSFGIWDAMMLWFMLDHIQDRQYAAMYYNHRDDPGMQQFR